MLQELHVDPMSILFHEEAAAAEAYKRAMLAHRGTALAVRLRELLVNHREAAGLVKRHVRKHAPRTDVCLEAWNAVYDTPTDNGEFSILEALKRGEECSRELYRKTLADFELPPGGRAMISAILLPQTDRHLAALDRLMAN